MTNPKVRYGDVYSPNRTGREVVVCDLSVSKDNSDFYQSWRVAKDGYDFTVQSIGQEIMLLPITERTEALIRYFEMIRVLATPLPAQVAFSVRIPYLFCCGSKDEWKQIADIIKKELIYYDIPVEIWMPEMS